MITENILEILIIEDNPNEVELTLRALRKINIVNNICVISDGEEALQYLLCTGKYKDRNLNLNPKVVLLDLKLPKVDGFEILKKVRSEEQTKSIPIVVLTSSREETEIIESYKLMVNSYIVKPVNFEKFIVAIKELGMYWILLNQLPQNY